MCSRLGTSASGGALVRCCAGASSARANLIGRSLAEVRLTQGSERREQFAVTGLIEEVAQAARLEANARGITFTVMPVEDGIAIEADRQVLSSVIGNLLQNAFKFTRPRTVVTLRVGTSVDRVLIEIEDECGGLPGTLPVCSARSTNEARTEAGLGLGLAYSRGPSKRIADESMRAPLQAAAA